MTRERQELRKLKRMLRAFPPATRKVILRRAMIRWANRTFDPKEAGEYLTARIAAARWFAG
jgi:hypothetical protein